MKERSSPATQYAEYETSSAFFFGEPSGLSSYFLIGSFVLCFKIEEDFYESFSRFEKFFPLQSPKSRTRKREEATRQQGGLFFRENSSNGGKAIRTFWRNTKFGKIPCQG
jgi:hypothetical protein